MQKNTGSRQVCVGLIFKPSFPSFVYSLCASPWFGLFIKAAEKIDTKSINIYFFYLKIKSMKSFRLIGEKNNNLENIKDDAEPGPEYII